jgi:hypothetical protein
LVCTPKSSRIKCDDFSFFRILGGGDEHHEEAHHQSHQIGKGHEPAVAA